MAKEYVWKEREADKEEYSYPVLGLEETLNEATRMLTANGIEELKAGTEIVVGIVRYVDVCEVIPPLADDVLENVYQEAYNNGGYWVEGYLDDVKSEELAELEDKLQTTVRRWLKRYGYMPNWFTVYAEQTYIWNGADWTRKTK